MSYGFPTTTATPQNTSVPFVPLNVHLNCEIKAFTVKADNLANQILSQNAPKSYEGPIVVRSHHYYTNPFFWPTFFSSPRVFLIDNNSKQDKDNDKAFLLGAVAVVVGGIALYALGSGIAAYQDASLELSETQEFKHILAQNSNTEDPKQKEQMFGAYQVANLKERICTRIKNSAVADIALRTGLLGSCGVVLAGTILTAPAAMTAGVIAGLITTGSMLFKWGFDSSDKANVRDAGAIQVAVQVLNKK